MSSVIGIDIEESCISHLLSMDEIEYTSCFHKLSGISIKKGSIIASIKTTSSIVKFSFDLQTKKLEVTKKEHTDSEFHPLSYNIEENGTLYMPDDGMRFEGPIEDDNPFGYGSLFNESNQLVYRGFMYSETKMCFGVEFYPDLGKVEYCGCYFGDARHGFGRLYDCQGELIYEGNWIYGLTNYDTSIVLNDIDDEVNVHNLIHELVIDEGCGNDYDDDLELSGYCYLERLEVRTNSFKNLKSLRISDNPVLKTIDTEDRRGGMDLAKTAPLTNVKSVVIESMIIEVSLI